MQPERKSGISVPLAKSEEEHKRDACATPERATRAAELLKSALEHDPQEWQSFLDEACGSDADLRAEVESLLRFQKPARAFMQQPAIHLAADVFLDRELNPDETVGDYKIISLIGSGGMGDVYLAEDRQLHREVALKIVRRGMNTDDVVRRFQREEQILASLNHPNIARLYGGAITTDGVPFFVMEYVDGTRLDQYCDEKRLSLSERLTLFRKVCSAVAYAHQHLVIHRDLKPSNIRVTSEGEPKLLDFGIAKLLDPATSVGGELTMTFPGAMTPEYASPEQVRGEAMTTTSDVYSLGVVLYKLLTGQSPYRTKTNRPDEIARAITEQEPTRPSTAHVNTNHQSALTNHNSRLLRGDLDNIILMAMRKEPSRRYESASQFSADIQRHLDGRPVIARKDTLKYRSAKFVGRNKVGVIAVGLVALTLFGGIVATLMEARRAEQQRARAEKRFNDVRKLANSLLLEILPNVAPGVSGGRVILVKRALEYLDSLAKEGRNDPALQRELALAYRNLAEQIENATGDFADILNSLHKALALDEALVKASPESEEARDELAREYQRIGRALWWGTDTEEALAFYHKALAVREPLARDHPQSFDFNYRLAYLYTSIADLSMDNWDTKEALRNFREAMGLLDLLKKGESPEHDLKRQRMVIYCHIHIAEGMMRDDNLTAALQGYDRALDLLNAVHATAPEDPWLRNMLGDLYAGQANTYRAQKEYERALEINRKRVALWEAIPSGDRDWRDPLATAYSDLGEVLCDGGDFVAAVEYIHKAISIFQELSVEGAKNRNLISKRGASYERLGLIQRKLGHYQEAWNSYDQALPLREQNAVDRAHAGMQNELASCCRDMALLHIDMAAVKDGPAQERAGHWRKAHSLCERSRKIFERLNGRYPEKELFKSKLEEVTQQLKWCDEALARL